MVGAELLAWFVGVVTVVNCATMIVNVGLLFAINKQYTEVLKIGHIKAIGRRDDVR